MKRTLATWIVGVGILLFLIVSIAPRKLKSESGTTWIVKARPAPAAFAESAEAKARKVPTTVQAANSSVSAGLDWSSPTSEAVFAQFVEWANRYRSADASTRKTLVEEGIRLAGERRAALRQLIKTDPKKALALATPNTVRRSLPQSVSELLEERLSARGSLAVLGALAEPGQEQKVTPIFRLATVGGREFQAFVYGRRLGEPSRRDIPLNGVAVDEFLAVSENPVRVLDADESAAVSRTRSEPRCEVSNERVDLAGTLVAAQLAGQTLFFCGPLHATQLNKEMIKAEVSGDSGGGGEVEASAATEGTKRLLFIRVDFSDLPGPPFSDSTGINLVSGLNAFFRESSFGRSGFALSGGVAINSGGSDVTPTFRMPQTAAYYGANDAYLQLRTDARNAAMAAGYVLSNYEYDVYCFGAVPGFGWAGLGYVGWPGAWLRSYFTVGVAGHELGHNYGLHHANYWDTGGQSVIGAGSTSEYGDVFDTMGSANGGANHFNARYKSYLNWLQGSETLTVTSSGTYRIYAHDNTNSLGRRVALKVPRSATTNYWVEFRQKFASNQWLMSGAGIRWTGNGNERSQLLDMTPGSPDGKNDSALVLGRTFSDYAAGVHITTLRKGNTTPESLDVVVNLGTFPENNDPVLAINADNLTPAAGATVLLMADGSDSGNDTLAYHWDFGDGTFGTNGALASKSWTSAGDYVVRCTASDMKGGVASKSLAVTVGNPGTYRISGRVTASEVPLEGVKVSVSSMKMANTDSDGTYTIAGLPAGSYSVSAQLVGYTFAASGFANPISVGPNAAEINFTSGSGGGDGGNTPGSVALTSPAANATYTAPPSIFLAASAVAGTGNSITKVEFFQGATKIGEDSALPYSLTWVSPPSGSYTLTARATETGGILLTSLPVSITVSPAAPAIISQPQSQTVAAGGTATFTVVVTGSVPLTYQWRLNGTNLAGASSATLSLFNVQSPQAGGYSVVVSNAGGTVVSSVATLTVTCSYSLSANSVSFGATGGGGSVNVTSQGGCSWSVANLPAWVTITSGNGGSGNGMVSYVVASNTTGASRAGTVAIAGRNYVVSQAAPDTSRPTVAFSSPSANATLTNSPALFSGTASDNDAVLRVEYQVGSGAFAVASGTEDWSGVVSLLPGTNVVSVRSIDLSGNISLTNSRTVFCSVPGTLVLAINGRGTVGGATNGQALAVGRVAKLTAKPSAGYVFSNWTGDVTGVSPTLNFMMQSNLNVTANFVTNPFAPTRGTFNGLFFETNEIRFGQSGAFSLKLTDKGGYTATLRIGAKRYAASGRMNLEGRATNIVQRSLTNALTVTWALNLDGTDEINGLVTDGTWNAALLGDRATFGVANPAPQFGRYTLTVLGSPGTKLGPEGDGYGTVSVDVKGFVTLKGSLSDKTAISGKVSLSKKGYWPLYVPLYSGKGALLSWVSFAEGPSTDFDGVMSWIKPAMSTTRYYPDGFTSEAALLGSRYSVPTGTNRLLGLTEATVMLSGGNLPQFFTNSVSVDAAGKVTILGSDSLTFTIAASSGQFSGKFMPVGGLPVSFKGAVLQKASYASGYFLGTNRSGRIALGNVQTGVEEPRLDRTNVR